MSQRRPAVADAAGVESQRRYATAGAVFAAASAVAVAPVAPISPWGPGLTAAERAVQLAAEASIFNIPFNLFQDIVNIPYHEVQATNVMANSLFFTGNWFTPSATNIWGEDPGDPGHFMAVMDFLFPFPQISGLYQPEIDPEALANGTAGLGQQMAMLAAAMLPVSPSCDPIQCYPLTPVEPITGFTGIDRIINFFMSLSNFPNDDNQLDMFKYWFKVPLGELFNGYTFPSGPGEVDNPTAGGIAEPVPGVGPDGSVPPGFGFTGTVPGGVDEFGNPINLQPWAGVTFTLDPFKPFELWFNSLMAPVDWSVNGDDPLTGFHLPDGSEVFQALKALVAGLVVDFNPFVPGSPMCPGVCSTDPFAPPFGVTTLDIVKSIQGIGDPNPAIQQWIELTEQGLANSSTDEQAFASVMALQTGMLTFDAETQAALLGFLGDINPYLPNLAVNSGLFTDPGFLGPWPQDEAGYYHPPGYDPSLPLADQTIGEYGGLNMLLLWDDFLRILDPSGGLVTQLDDLWADMAGWFTF